MANIAVTDGMDPVAVNNLINAGHNVVEQHYTQEELASGALADFDAVVIRSATKLSSVVIEKSKKIKSATKKQIQSMANLCIQNLEKKNFFKQIEKKPIMLENLRSIFYKMDLSEKETRILSSVFASLAKKKVD